jgi:glutathione peroxidase
MNLLQPTPASRPLARAALALLLCTASVVVCVQAASAQTPGPAAVPSPPASPNAACPRLLRHTHDRLQDEKPHSLCQYRAVGSSSLYGAARPLKRVLL